MDYRFCCFGTHQNIFKCLVKCPDRKECEEETERRKALKELDKELSKNEKKK